MGLAGWGVGLSVSGSQACSQLLGMVRAAWQGCRREPVVGCSIRQLRPLSCSVQLESNSRTAVGERNGESEEVSVRGTWIFHLLLLHDTLDLRCHCHFGYGHSSGYCTFSHCSFDLYFPRRWYLFMCLVAFWIHFFGEFTYVCFAPLPILNYVTFCCLIVRTLGWEPWWKSGGSGVEMRHPARYGYSSLTVPPAVVASPAPAPTGQPLLLEQLCGVSTLPSDSQPEVVGASGHG